jgi:FkbM family methyltransferase
VGLWLEARRNCNDVRQFGPSFLLRHLSRLSGRNPVRASIPGAGTVYLRNGESDLQGFRQVFAYREYDLGAGSPVTKRVGNRYRAILDSGQTPVIVDAGANVGAASLWFRSQFPQAAVIAIEPEPNNAQILRRNTAERPGVSVIEAAIGSESGFVEVCNEGQGWAAHTVRSSSGVRVITVEEAAKTVPNGGLFIVKVDIEGFESDLFSANLDWIDQAHMVIIEPHDWMLPGQGTSASFQTAMAGRGFELFISGENLIYVRL